MKKLNPARKFQYFYPHIVQTQMDQPHQPRCLSWFCMAWQNQERCYEKVFLTPKKSTGTVRDVGLQNGPLQLAIKCGLETASCSSFALLGQSVVGCKFALVMGCFKPDPLDLASPKCNSKGELSKILGFPLKYMGCPTVTLLQVLVFISPLFLF